MTEIPFPRTSRPALSALAHAGYTHLGELDGIPMRAILDLHGMGPKGVGTLRRAMAEHGWAFADDDPRVGAVAGGGVSLTEGAQPERNDNTNLRVGERSAHEWVASLPKARQRDQGEAMLDLFGEVTGVDPVMWGPSIVGYGELTLYGLAESPDALLLLDRLGRHKRSVACVYIPRLEDVDDAVLRDLVTLAWATGGTGGASDATC